MRVDLLETLFGDVVRELQLLSPSGIASQLAVVAIVTLGLVEAGWLATQRRASDRPRLVKETATAAVLGVGGLIAGIALGGLFVFEFALVQSAAPGFITRFWANNEVLGLVVAFVAWDLVGYLYHRIGHCTAFGWAAHRPHHTGDDFTLSLAWRQSWLPVHAVVLPLVAIGGWSLSTIVVCAAVSNVIQALQHTSAPIRYPRLLVAICMTPVQHRHHHHRRTALDRSTGEAARIATAVNLGPVFTIWDRLAGTYRATPIDSNATYGVGTAGTNPLRLQFEGWQHWPVERGLRSVADPSVAKSAGCQHAGELWAR